MSKEPDNLSNRVDTGDDGIWGYFRSVGASDPSGTGLQGGSRRSVGRDGRCAQGRSRRRVAARRDPWGWAGGVCPEVVVPWSRRWRRGRARDLREGTLPRWEAGREGLVGTCMAEDVAPASIQASGSSTIVRLSRSPTPCPERYRRCDPDECPDCLWESSSA